MAKGIGYSIERTEKDPTVVVNVGGYNVAVEMHRILLSGRDGMHTQIQLRVDSPDLLLNEGHRPEEKIGAAEKNWEKRKKLMREVEQYIMGQLGDARYNFSYSNEGLVITAKSREHEEAKHERQSQHSFGIRALDDEFFGDPLEGAKKTTHRIRDILNAAKRNPDLLMSAEVDVKATEAARVALQRAPYWIEEGTEEIRHGDDTYAASPYYRNHLILDSEKDFQLNRAEFIKGVRQFAVDHDLDIGIRSRNDGYGFYLEASPEAHEQLARLLPEKNEIKGAMTHPPEVTPGKNLPPHQARE